MKNNTLPTTLAEILAVAAPSFENSEVASVNVQASWGPVNVNREGEVKAGHVIA